MSENQIVVGWAGNYRRIGKNFDVAFHVCDQLGYKLKVAGFLKTMLYIPHDNMPDFYRSIDVLLVTSTVEAHPLVVYEALACGTPVVMLRVGDCHWENIPGIYYYKSLTVRNINRAITVAYKNRVALGHQGRAEIVSRWQWKHWIPVYDDMFQKVANKKRDISIAMVIDKPGWAWDTMCGIIRGELLKTRRYSEIDIYYHKGVDKEKGLHVQNLQEDKYDVILNHYWQLYNHKNHVSFLHHKTIPCANGDAYKSKTFEKLFSEVVSMAPAIATVSNIIAADLREKFKKPVYHCSRGVDTDKFKP